MDKNSILGLILIAGILGFFVIYNKPSEEEIAKQERVRDSIALIEKQRAAEEALAEIKQTNQQQTVANNVEIPDSIKNQQIEREFGEYSNAALGHTQLTTIENDVMKITFSNKGGKIYSVELKDYKTYDSLPLKLFDGDSTVFGIGLHEIGKSTDGLFFEPSESNSNIKVTSNSKAISYKLYKNDKNSFVEFLYTIPKDEYMIKFDVKFHNYTANTNNYANLKWDLFMPAVEKGRKWEDENSTIHYKYWQDEDDELNARSNDIETEKLTGRVKWVAFKQQFFSSIIIADEYFLRGGTVTTEPLVSDKHLKKVNANLDLAFDKKEIGLSFYFGPNHFPTLKKYDMSMERLIPLGWGIFGWVNRFAVIPLFNFLSGFMSNYGLIILILTIIIKIGLFPLTYKSYLSTAKMRVLKPEVEELGKKYPKKEHAMQKQQATMALYRKAGVNPMGGCIPMIIQMPILIAMFRFFPASIELRQKSFLWAEDLSTYDSILNLPFDIPFYGAHVSLFTLLMAASMILTTMSNSSNMTTAPGQPNMKVMMWMMPVMMLFWFNSYSSGLSFYYFIANMITFIQTWLIGKTVDDAAILRQLKENKAKPKKKSKFQQRIEEMQRRQKDMRK